MDAILFFSQTLDLRKVLPAISRFTVTSVATKSALATKVVEDQSLQAAVLQVGAVDGEWQSFLTSLSAGFPLLPIAVITRPENAERLPVGVVFVNQAAGEAQLVEALKNLLHTNSSGERRRHHRFDWPLRGHFNPDGDLWMEHEIRSLSAGGALLEYAGRSSKPATEGRLRIAFRNCEVEVKCTILDPRRASTNLPAGFGVRFTEAPPGVDDAIDGIVKEALVQSLLHPEAEPEIPSLDGGLDHRYVHHF
jgi:hypothetical protein